MGATRMVCATRWVGVLRTQSRSVEVIEGYFKAGMSVSRFDFSGGANDYHQETLENLKIVAKGMNKLCAIMLDTVGPELQVFNRSEEPIVLEIDAFVILTPVSRR